MELKKQKKMK